MFKRYVAAVYKGFFDLKDNLDLLGLMITMASCVSVFGVPYSWLGKMAAFMGYYLGWQLLKLLWAWLFPKKGASND
jgi:hypothetical protein